jgi:hypothetical protein
MIFHPSGVTCCGRAFDKEGLKQTFEFVDVVSEELLWRRATANMSPRWGEEPWRGP